MDDFLRYEEFFKEEEDSDEDSEDNDYPGSSEGSSYDHTNRTEKRDPLRSSGKEKGADTGCVIMFILGVIWVIYIIFQL